MRREILCKECGVKEEENHPNLNPFPGEHIKRVWGWVNQGLVCDRCLAPLRSTSRAMAMSIYTTSRPYFPWESDYLELERGE